MIDEKYDIDYRVTGQIVKDYRAVFFDEAESGFMLFDENLTLIDINCSLLQEIQVDRTAAIGRKLGSFKKHIAEFNEIEVFLNVLWCAEPVYFETVKNNLENGAYINSLKAFKIGNNLAVIIRRTSIQDESAQEKQAFIYRASHDLRGPIARILGVLNLSDGIVNELDEARHFFKLLRQQADTLDGIVRNLVQGNNIRRSRTEFNAIDFWDLFEESVKNISQKKDFSSIRIEKSVNQSNLFYNDGNLIKELLSHLLDNAMKYRSRCGKQAVLKLSAIEVTGGVQLSVEDNGRGIPLRLQEKVFQMFFRSENEFDGKGLGLYLVRQIVAKLSAQLCLRSDTELGARFTITIPNQGLRAKAA